MAIGLHDTIAAIASPPGPAERGIIRISGENILETIGRVFCSNSDAEQWRTTKRAIRTEGHINVPSLSVPLPAALMLWPTSRSYTGQPMAELHTIGSPPLLEAVFERLTECGARMANRGEFTMRAFLAGRLDLVQAEAVLGVIDASDHEELESALSQLGGGITAKLAGVRGQLLSLLGDLEAGLDFVEEDIEFITAEQIVQRLRQCASVLQQLIDDSQTRLPSGYRPRVVLAGLPNAGKSTLFNCLIGSTKAIVSAIAGTTRDYLNASARFGDIEVELIDTAGWEAARDLIMQHAQDLRSEQLNRCDLIIWCSAIHLSDAAAAADHELRQAAVDSGIPLLKVQTQCDLKDAATQTGEALRISVQAGTGIEQLATAIQRALAEKTSARSELLFTTAARCRDTLRQAAAAIDAAIASTEAAVGDEIIALELRDALHQIGVILGEVYTDDILDHIFSNFCIGK